MTDKDESKPADKEKNPYRLIWYQAGMSQAQTDLNNAKYWAWEIDNNGLKPGFPMIKNY